MAHASDSLAQREAEVEIVALVGIQLGVELTKQRIGLPGGSQVEVDGAPTDLSVLVEAFARIGPMKGGQKRKVALDVLKLITVRRHHPAARLILAFCDPAAAASITGWAAEAIKTWEVEMAVVELDPALQARVLEAQDRQFR